MFFNIRSYQPHLDIPEQGIELRILLMNLTFCFVTGKLSKGTQCCFNGQKVKCVYRVRQGRVWGILQQGKEISQCINRINTFGTEAKTFCFLVHIGASLEPCRHHRCFQSFKIASCSLTVVQPRRRVIKPNDYHKVNTITDSPPC